MFISMKGYVIIKYKLYLTMGVILRICFNWCWMRNNIL